MALTDNNEPLLNTAPASGNDQMAAGLPKESGGALRPASLRALARLPEIHAETLETTSLARFLRSAVGASAMLMLMGAVAVGFAGGASLQQEFAWSLLVLAGVAAMLRCYIKSIAQAFDRAPLRESARDLRAVLFYVGFAWGAGAFLLLGSNPVPVMGLCFAVLPCVLLAPLLRDKVASLGFILPVTALTAAAILLQPWSDAVVALAMLLIVQGSICAGLALSGGPRTSLPSGLSLR